MTFSILDIAGRFARGQTYEQYLAHMQKNRPTVEAMAGVVALTPEDEHFFRGVHDTLGHPIHVVVVSEDWCPDCGLNVPILMHIAALNPAFEVRFVGREDNYHVLAHCLKEGRKAIPTIIFFDARWNEIGHWVERPVQVDVLLKEWDRSHPSPQEPDRASPPWREFREARSRYREELFFARGLWRETIAELRRILAREVFSNVPAESLQV